jgi:hypothetical protein
VTGRYLAIAVSALLTLGASAHAAEHIAARAPSPAHGPSNLRAAARPPGGMVTAAHPAATRSSVAPVPTASGARAAALLPITTPPVRPYNARVPYGSGKSGRAQVNATLGGPATFDARKLVRR